MANRAWYRDRSFLLEAFIAVNLAFLAVDIYVAHSVNAFAHWAEWIPFYFSLASPILLVPVLWSRNPMGRWSRPAGFFVGWLAIAVGIAGLFYHLHSQFFSLMTLSSLVYTAPFVAPLAYTGIGFLLLLNRMQDANTRSWGIWVIVLANGGFLGNFILSVCDHAQNGFFHWAEWIPVVASALAIGFLAVCCLRPRDVPFARMCLGMMAIQMLVGLLGFLLSLRSQFPGYGRQCSRQFHLWRTHFCPTAVRQFIPLGRVRHCGSDQQSRGELIPVIKDFGAGYRNVRKCRLYLNFLRPLFHIPLLG